MENKIKVVWLCYFSNPFVHKKLDLGYGFLMKIFRKAAHKPMTTDVPEFANWVTNGIAEFEKFEDVELHIVAPYPHLRTKFQEFCSNGVYYHFFQSEEDNAWRQLYRKIMIPKNWSYRRNRKIVASIIEKIQPAVVHLFGAENPNCSLGVLDVDKDIVTIASLQTLMNDPDFRNNNTMPTRVFQYRASVEKAIIERVDFPATPVVKYRKIIWNGIRPEATILNISLALKDSIVRSETEKRFDFVYFAADLSKAADLALEAFGRAYKQRPELTIDVIGGYDASFKQVLDEIIHRYEMEKAVTFEGRLPSHDEVLVQIRKSRFALLPLRIDLTSGTIREAMSNGLPVLTTDTGELGTKRLNEVLQCALISDKGNHQALADNMIMLLNNAELADTLKQNAYKMRSAVRSNEETSRNYIEAYKACLNYKKNGEPIPEALTKV